MHGPGQRVLLRDMAVSHALAELAGHFHRYDLTDAVVASTGLRMRRKASAAFVRRLGTPVAVRARQ